MSTDDPITAPTIRAEFGGLTSMPDAVSDWYAEQVREGAEVIRRTAVRKEAEYLAKMRTPDA